MALPSVIQGLIKAEDGKVFELDSPEGSAWVETIGSFRFEPTGGGKPCTVRKEASGYWYGCRKVVGKVRKKYIGKSPEVTVAKLKEVVAALDVPPVPRVKQVAQVAKKVVQVAEISADRFTALELQVANLQKALEALQERLPGKSEPGDSAELPKVDNAVVEGLRNDLGNLKTENVCLRQKLAESQNTVGVLNRETEALTRQLKVAQTENQRLHKDLSNLDAERQDIVQIKKELKQVAADLHQQERSIKLEEARWQRELSDARAELGDAKATILNQGNKIRELERGYSLKPNPAERRLRLEIGELQTQLSDLKQKSATAGKVFPEAADVYNQFKAGNPKTKITYRDVEKILAMIEKSCDDTSQED